LTNIRVKNTTNLNGAFTGLTIKNAKTYDGTGISIIDLDFDLVDFTTIGSDYVVTMSDFLPVGYKIFEALDIEVKYKKSYKNFDYRDAFNILYEFNIRNFNITDMFSAKSSFSSSINSNLNIAYMNLNFQSTTAKIECFPQKIYTKSIGASIFDIDDYI
jgi:hypothetical protein